MTVIFEDNPRMAASLLLSRSLMNTCSVIFAEGVENILRKLAESIYEDLVIVFIDVNPKGNRTVSNYKMLTELTSKLDHVYIIPIFCAEVHLYDFLSDQEITGFRGSYGMSDYTESFADIPTVAKTQERDFKSFYNTICQKHHRNCCRNKNMKVEYLEKVHASVKHGYFFVKDCPCTLPTASARKSYLVEDKCKDLLHYFPVLAHLPVIEWDEILKERSTYYARIQSELTVCTLSVNTLSYFHKKSLAYSDKDRTTAIHTFLEDASCEDLIKHVDTSTDVLDTQTLEAMQKNLDKLKSKYS